MKIQIVKKKCCGAVFAACCEPECYTDKDWLRELKKYIAQGCIVEMQEAGTGSVFTKCQCVKAENKSSHTQQLALL